MSMKKLLLFILFIAVTTVVSAKSQPKYIFYFIGDGMGMNMVGATEAYLADKQGEIGNERLNFSKFPYIGIIDTYAANRYITDSAAAGTALAAGDKTSIGTIGMDANHENNLESVADVFKEQGKAIGILSSVSIDHATPASFYASQKSREMYNEISNDAVPAGFDIYGGSGFIDAEKNGVNVYDVMAQNGYHRIKGKSELSLVDDMNKKYIITESENNNQSSLKYRIDRDEDAMSLADMLKASIPYLKEKGGKNGFFIMAEGGMIDWAGHSNDGVTVLEEVIDLHESVAVALEFYKKYPKQTLIIVTSDHETGGFALGNRAMNYATNLSLMENQKCSQSELEVLLKESNDSWAKSYNVLEKELGFGKGVEITKNQMTKLKLSYANGAKTLARESIKILNSKIGFGWTSGSHTGSPVAVFSIGCGADEFTGYFDNTDITRILKK